MVSFEDTAVAPPDIGAEFARTRDFEHLWHKTGFTQVADYAIRYWRVHLGKAFNLWEFLVREDRRDVRQMRKGHLPYWMPPTQYRYRELATVLGCSRKTITGRLAPCHRYERQKQTARDKGQPPSELVCCEKYTPHEMRWNHKTGEYQCMHWLEGMLERLYREGLVAVEEESAPGKPRAHTLPQSQLTFRQLESHGPNRLFCAAI